MYDHRNKILNPAIDKKVSCATDRLRAFHGHAYSRRSDNETSKIVFRKTFPYPLHFFLPVREPNQSKR